MTRRIIKIMMAFVLALGLIAGSFAPLLPVNDFAITVEAKAKKPKVNKTKITLSTGETFTLTIKNASGKFKFSSSNKKVASVNKKGVITAKKNGSAKITAKVGKKKLTCKVTVKKMSIDKKSLTVVAGSTATITLKNGKNVKWSSSSGGIASVIGNDSSATVKGLKEGKTIISAKAGSVTLKCNVTVSKGSGDNSGDAGNSGSSQYVSNVKQPTIQYSLVDRQASRGREMVNEQLNSAHIIYNGFPKNVEDLKKINRGDGAGTAADGKQDGKYITVACLMAALAAYSEGRDADGKAMMDYLLVSPSVSAQNVGGAGNLTYYFGYDDKKTKLPWAFFDGSTKANNYTPSQPLSITVEEYPYAPVPFSTYGVDLEKMQFHTDNHPCLKNNSTIQQ